MSIKVMTIFGTRPEAIKMAPVVLELQKYPDKVGVVVAVTGQHREMLKQVLDVFRIKPQYNLDIMRQKQSLAEITTRALEGLEETILQERPDIVLAQGDTTSTFAASLAAFYNKISVGHVEAGLRTDNKYDPFPEEINRRLTSVLADLHFAPTPAAKKNLLDIGVHSGKIFVTGNTVIDALLSVAEQTDNSQDEILDSATDGRRILLITAHRRENWGEPMTDICKAIKTIVARFPDIIAVFAVHKNPIVRDTVYSALGDTERIRLIEPPDYVPFIRLLKRSHIILTDSGGVQEEAPALGKPVLVLRKTTERPEGVEAGTSRLVGTNADDIVNSVVELLTNEAAYYNMARAINPYGDGSASVRIRQALFEYFGID